ncbi:hypothetical protein ACTXT7_017614, partial [Hymenolepis weldensis]
KPDALSVAPLRPDRRPAQLPSAPRIKPLGLLRASTCTTRCLLHPEHFANMPK